MISIDKPEVKCVDFVADGTYAKFAVEPLERGYGITLGNSLRRVLLSSLPGIAVNSIEIEGVEHEFSTIPGVKEDVVEIVLNLKGLRVKFLDEEISKTVYINAEGECEVTAGSIIKDDTILILDPDMHIASLSQDAKLQMTINIDRGKGYIPADKHKGQNEYNIGIIPIDSIYTPVLKVNYIVENTRVGQITDYDRLIIEIWTNGVISAKDAITEAAEILSQHIELFKNVIVPVPETKIIIDENIMQDRDNILELPIEYLDLSVRAFNCLQRSGIKTVSDLVHQDRRDLSKVRNMGKKSIEEVINKLKSLGFDLTDKES